MTSNCSSRYGRIQRQCHLIVALAPTHCVTSATATEMSNDLARLRGSPTERQGGAQRSLQTTRVQAITDMLDAALSYAAIGLPVFPVSGAKVPFKGSAGRKDASTDPDRVRAMWHAHPSAMVAVATGDRSGYCVLDVDTKEAHGADGRATAKKLGLSFDGGVIALTPSGGWHVWFKTGGQTLPSKNGLDRPRPRFQGRWRLRRRPAVAAGPEKGRLSVDQRR
jgi:Bifunctional DNA primase/polymerase, N-terminal